MEFKVGDRVRVLADSCLKGREADVVETIGEKITVTSGVVLGYFNKDDLELIQPSKKPTLEELEKRIEKLEKCVMGEQKTIAKLFTLDRKEPLEIILGESNEETKPSLLTEDERVILRNLDKKWKWIARDEDRDDLHVYSLEPVKTVYEWNVEGVMNFENFYIFNHLFQFIKWEDDEPYNIEELLKGECGNE